MSLVRSTKSIQSSVTEKAMMKQMMKQFDLNSMRLLAGASGLFTILALTPAGVIPGQIIQVTVTISFS